MAQEESRSTPALLTSSSSALDNSIVSLGVTPEHSFMESCARLSVSLEGPGLFALTSSPLPTRKHDLSADFDDDDDDIDEDDYNNDGDDDEEDNHNSHSNDPIQRHQHQSDNKEFVNSLEVSNCRGDVDSENMEYYPYKPNFRTCLSSTVGKTRKLKCRSSSASNDQLEGRESNAGDDTFTDSQEDVDDEMACVVKRRYKQNRQKASNTNTAQTRLQQQRRFRISTTSNPKSLEAQNCDFFPKEYMFIGKSKTSTISSLTLKALADPSTSTNIVQQKSRVCGRCKRGIRHSSTCSSSTTSGGVACSGAKKNGSGMTLDELRAVNRYAESTKSLSYLPQVRDEQLLASRFSI